MRIRGWEFSEKLARFKFKCTRIFYKGSSVLGEKKETMCYKPLICRRKEVK